MRPSWPREASQPLLRDERGPRLEGSPSRGEVTEALQIVAYSQQGHFERKSLLGQGFFGSIYSIKGSGVQSTVLQQHI